MSVPGALPEDDALAAFGPRVRRARLERGLSARALADRLGISASAVSQIETGKIRPSMKRLHDIVTVLGLDLEHVFAPGTTPGSPAGHGTSAPPEPAAPAGPEPPATAATAATPATAGTPAPEPDGGAVAPGVHVMREGEHPRLVLEDGIEWFQLAPVPLPRLEVLRTVYPPGARAGLSAEFIRHAGWELGLVLSGRIEVQVAFATRVVGPGDTICFDSSVPHKLSNPFDEPVVAVWIRGLGGDRLPPLG